MSRSGAHEGDMFDRLVSDEEIEDLLSGGMGREDLRDLAAFVGSMEARLSQPPAEDVSRRHLAAMVRAAEQIESQRSLAPARERQPSIDASPRTTWRSVLHGRFPRVAVRALAAALVASVLTVGLAFAGVVELPEPAADALEAVGVTLPQQDDDPDTQSVPSPDQLPDNADATAIAVLEAVNTYLPQVRDGSITGCEFGALVSAAARGEEADTSHCAGPPTEEEQTADPRGGPETGAEASTGGKSVADEARESAVQGGPDTGGQASSGGAGTADEASGGAPAGPETGSSAASDARGNSP